MKRSYLITALTLILLTPTYGQYVAEKIRADSILTTPNAWRVLFFLPGVAYETRLGPRITFATDLRITGYYEHSNIIASTGASGGSRYVIYPYFTAGFRRYYNLARRLYTGKSTKANSGNYLAIRGLYLFSPVLERQTAGTIFIGAKPKTGIPGVALLWGLQRTYRRNLYLNLNVGAMISNGYKYGYGPTADFVIGYSLYAR